MFPCIRSCFETAWMRNQGKLIALLRLQHLFGKTIGADSRKMESCTLVHVGSRDRLGPPARNLYCARSHLPIRKEIVRRQDYFYDQLQAEPSNQVPSPM